MLKKRFALNLEKIIGQSSERPDFKGQRLSYRSVFLGWNMKSEESGSHNHLENDLIKKGICSDPLISLGQKSKNFPNIFF